MAASVSAAAAASWRVSLRMGFQSYPILARMWNKGRGGASRFAVLLCLSASALSARAGEPAAVELVLALDSSASVDRDEFALEVNGLSQAFRDPEVIRS